MLKPLLVALVVALPIAGAAAQDLPLTDLPLTPLPAQPTTAPKKKPTPAKAKKKPAPKPVEAKGTPVDSGGALVASPPAELPEVPLLSLSTRIAVAFVRTPLVDSAVASELESGLRSVAALTPLAQNPTVLRAPLDGSTACRGDDDACFIARAAHDGLDTVVVETAEKNPGGVSVSLRLRQLLVLGRKANGEVAGEAPDDRVSLLAESEALYCKLMVPAGCASEVLIDTGSAEIVYQGHALPRGTAVPMRATLPVGLISLSARAGTKTGPARVLPITREKTPGLLATVRIARDGTPTLVTPAEMEKPAPAIAVAPAPAPTQKARWIKPAGYAVAGVGSALLVAGLIEGLHSKSLINDAHSSYNAHGGAYAQGDLPGLASGNSAAHTANILFIAGGIVAAAGLTLAFAF